MAAVRPEAIAQDLDRLSALGLEALRQEWRRLYRGPPPRLTRALFVLALSYRVQENACGLGASTRRQRASHAKDLQATGRVAPAPSLALKPGARLVREWRGRTHAVTVTERGFEYGGATYASLSLIACKITGAHWSGPRFFGLPKAAAKRKKGIRHG
jgi:hypothetical protein